MKYFCLSLWQFSAFVLSFTTTDSFAQDFELQWAHAVTGTHWLAAGPMTVDDQGNFYATGSFLGTVDFDPVSGNAILSADTVFGEEMRFIAKYDPNGNFLFVHEFEAGIRDIVTDNQNNLYVAGQFMDTVDFDLGPNTTELISGGPRDIFVAKYDLLGNFINVFSVDGTGFNDLRAIVIDAYDNVYITGEFRGTADFDPGSETFTLESTTPGDVFLAKYTDNGDLNFAFNLNGTSSQPNSSGVSLALDQQGNIILGGRFWGTIDLDPGTGTNLFTSPVGVDGFIAKYDSDGNHLSGHSYDGTVYFVALDKSDNLYVTGTMTDSMDVDPGPGVAMLYSENNFDVWMAKYDAQGNYLHSRAYVNNEMYYPSGLAANQLNNIYLTGRFSDTLNLNPGGINGKFYSQGNNDGFIGKFDPEGNFLFGASFGSTSSDEIFDLAVDHHGGVWITGSFTGTVDFDPGESTSNLSSPDGRGIFIAKYLDDINTDISESSEMPFDLNIYSAYKHACIDFSALNKVDAQVKIINLMGQIVAETNHTSNDLLQINLSDTYGQIYLVMVSNGSTRITKKIWIW